MRFFEETAAFRISRFYATYNRSITSRSAKKGSHLHTTLLSWIIEI
jgi:hypothetical protein